MPEKETFTTESELLPQYPVAHRHLQSSILSEIDHAFQRVFTLESFGLKKSKPRDCGESKRKKGKRHYRGTEPEQRKGNKQMKLLGVIAGLVVAILVGVINGWMNSAFEFDFTQVLLFVVPAGAFLVGFPSGFAASFVSGVGGSKTSFAAAMMTFVGVCISGILTMLSYHYFAYLQEGGPARGIGFLQYHELVLSSYSISFRGSPSVALGEQSSLLGYSEYGASVLGALCGWIGGIGSSRTVGGIKTLPGYYDDIADLLVGIASVDGPEKRSETIMAAKGLALTMDNWFESPGKKLSDQISVLAAKKIELAGQRIGARHLDVIAQAIPQDKKALLLLIGAATWSVAAADADLSPHELAELHRVLSLIGLHESDWDQIEKLGMLQISGHVRDLRDAAPLKVTHVEQQNVTSNKIDDDEMPGATLGAVGLVRSERGTIYSVGYLLHCVFIRSGPYAGNVQHSIEVWADIVSTIDGNVENAPIDSFRVFEREFAVGQPRVTRRDNIISGLLLSHEHPDIVDSIEKWVRKGVFIGFRLADGVDSFQAIFPGADQSSDTLKAWQEFEDNKRRIATGSRSG